MKTTSQFLTVRRLLLSLVAGATIMSAFAQSVGGVGEIPYLPNEIVSEPSPQAAGLTTNFITALDYSSGVLRMSMPLFSLQAGSLPVAISLSYATGAVNHDEKAGVTGIGWKINGGGVINRTVIGFPDELKGCDTGDNVYSENSLFQYLKDVSDEKIDAALDRYSYSIPGYSGTFYILSDGTIRQFPNSDVIIARKDDPTESGKHIFTILTPDGVEHTFADRETAKVDIVPMGLESVPKERHYSSPVHGFCLRVSVLNMQILRNKRNYVL